MKITVVCNIPMRKIYPTVYLSRDAALPSIDSEVVFPINAFLPHIIATGDDIQILLLTKNGMDNESDNNISVFKQEFERLNSLSGISYKYTEINTDFEEKKEVHEQLLMNLADEIRPGDHIYADVTYGSKDVPIVAFTAFRFAEKFLGCEIDNIIYGQATKIVDGRAEKAIICDYSPLYYLSSVTEAIQCTDPDKSKSILKTLLSV